MDLSQLSKPAIITELIETKNQVSALQGELMKSQFQGAIRLDVIRLLGFIANRDPAPDVTAIAPEEPEVRAIMALELEDLAKHLRGRADAFDAHAQGLRVTDEDDGEDPIN